MNFYHVEIESPGGFLGQFEYALDLPKDRLISQFINPYEKEKYIIVNGKAIATLSIRRLKITQTHEDSGTFVGRSRKSGKISSSSKISMSDFINMGEEVTYKFIKGPPGYRSSEKKEQEKEAEGQKEHSEYSGKVFIVHGHDEMLKNDMERFVGELGLEPVVLHRQPDKGLTIIEKLEEYSNVGYAFVLLTPDDIGFPVEESQKEEGERAAEFRARQNVIFEFGYLIGRLGRSRVCCIYKQDITLPTDISGLVYKKIKHSIGEVEYLLAKELKEVGYNV
jgi:predicted nucleotide-binding protein